MYVVKCSVVDLDPNHFGKSDPDPHQSEKSEPDRHKSDKSEPDPTRIKV
jgi:hypothetical protein